MAKPFAATPEMSSLLDQARHGSRAAAVELLETWKDHVLRAVRAHLGWPLRRLYDSDEFLQEVALELCYHDLPPEVFESAERFMSYLAGMAVNKVSEARRRYDAVKRALERDFAAAARERVHLLEEAQCFATTADAADHLELQEFEERWAQLERELPPAYRWIVRSRRLDRTHEAIAKELKINERTVRRVWRKFVESFTPPPP